MNFRLQLKNAVESLPSPVAHTLANIPYSLKLGPEYGRTKKMILEFRKFTVDVQEQWLLKRLQEIMTNAWHLNPFYKQHWQRHGFEPDHLTSLEHLNDVPIVTKKLLSDWALEARSNLSRGAIKINTGGTTGQPLEFLVDRQAFAREWAHMHTLWFAAGYRTSHLKLTFRGRNLKSIATKFNAIHNEIIVNTYCDRHRIAEDLQKLVRRTSISWLHGYPSVIAEFCDWCERNYPSLMASLRCKLRGVLLGSEYPAPHYVRTITKLASSHIVSWYGHSEMAVFAGNRENDGVYQLFPTYGLAEAIDIDGYSHLVATSLWNTASHFIRYDTGDGIAAENGGLVEKFCVTEGRIGEFVVDARGNRIGLTALIFGRHHDAFERAAHIQVKQNELGEITIIFVPKPGDYSTNDEIASAFDFSSTALKVNFLVRPEPFRTQNGKTPLLVRRADCIA